MPTSEARTRANRKNAQHSTGPKTPEGKDQSRRNGMKHGMAGAGIIVTPADATEVRRRSVTLQNEMAPQTAIGEILVGQLAMLSVRMERSAQQEFACVAELVRHASEDFDNGRIVQAEELLARLAEDPRKISRQLRKSPEGVELMLEAWGDLRRMLTRTVRPVWSEACLEKAVNLMGLLMQDVKGSRLQILTSATCNCFLALPESERVGRESEDLKAWARGLLVERVDAEIAELEEHYATLDRTLIEQDRAEAGDRALFDTSREATLARRYESEARRGFFKALDQFRKVEAEAALSQEPAPAEAPPLGSSRESRGVTLREPQPVPPQASRSAQPTEMVVTQSRDRTKAFDPAGVEAG